MEYSEKAKYKIEPNERESFIWWLSKLIKTCKYDSKNVTKKLDHTIFKSTRAKQQ